MGEIIGLSKSSQEIKQNYAYFCFDGANYSGYDFIDEALTKGAIKIIGEKSLDLPNYEQVKNVNEAMIEYAQKIYDNPQDKIKLIGITGTDGKTSTALLTNMLLNKLSSSSYLGTNGFFLKNKEIEYTDFTTPFADKFYDYLAQSVREGVEHLALEVSSHALDQNRLGNIKYDVTVFTNLSSEHLDYHETVEKYYEAKKKLFNQTKEGGTIILNIDDVYGKKIYEEYKNKNILTISLENTLADLYATNVQLNIKGTTFDLKYKNKTYKVSSPLLAKFNVYNLLESVACVMALGYDLTSILQEIKDVYVPGRLEIIPSKNKTIIIDFAHTPEAIHKVMKFINNLKSRGKIHVLTGSAGGRDSQKRTLMGEYAAKYSDFLYLTEDDPRAEDVSEISKQIKSGIKNLQCIVSEEPDRKKAIKKMLQNSGVEDILILFGKGTMKYMYYDNYKEKYVEKEEVEKLLEE